MPALTLAAAQFNPRLGDLEHNLRRHLEIGTAAADAGASLLLFPELSLTGYALRDLVYETALGADDGRLAPLRELSRRLVLGVGFVECSDTGLHYNTHLLLAGGRLCLRHRKLQLSTHGMFEEGRFFAAGSRLAAADTPLGRMGLQICSDWWHPAGSLLLAHDGASLLLAPVASPLRGLSQRPASAPGWMEAPGGDNGRVWYTLLSAQAKAAGLPILFCNRVGFEDGIGFWGGSSLWGPDGLRLAGFDHADEELLLAELDLDAVRRERIRSPLLRDGRLEVWAAELARLQTSRNTGDGDSLDPRPERRQPAA
jgi:predicted amidohydrolase